MAAGFCTITAHTQTLPPDVRAGHWAAAQVQSVLRNGVLTAEADKAFHGDATVTHVQAILALAKLAHALEGGTWQASKSIPISSAKTGIAPKAGTWESKDVSRYVFASVLTRMGDFVTAVLVRPKADEKDLGKSIAIPDAVHLSVPKTSPAYDSLAFLAKGRMVTPGSPLLAADDKPLKSAEMSRALHDLVTGLNDRLTDLGHDEDGGTREAPHAPPAAKKK